MWLGHLAPGRCRGVPPRSSGCYSWDHFPGGLAVVMTHHNAPPVGHRPCFPGTGWEEGTSPVTFRRKVFLSAPCAAFPGMRSRVRWNRGIAPVHPAVMAKPSRYPKLRPVGHRPCSRRPDGWGNVTRDLSEKGLPFRAMRGHSGDVFKGSLESEMAPVHPAVMAKPSLRKAPPRWASALFPATGWDGGTSPVTFRRKVFLSAPCAAFPGMRSRVRWNQ